MKEKICRNCNHKLDANSPIEGEDRSPRVGDVSICFYCGTPSVFDDELNLRPMTNSELKDIRENDPDAYRMMQKVLTLITKKINNQ